MHVRYGRIVFARGIVAALAAGTIAAILMAVSPTMAQMRGTADAAVQEPKVLDETVIAERLVRAGYTDLSRLRRRGAHYTVDATTRHGMRAKLVLNGGTGEILGLKLLPDAYAPTAGGF